MDDQDFTTNEAIPMTPSHTAQPQPTLGGLITEARKKRGWTEQRLAAMVGTTQQTVNKIEKGSITYSRYLGKIMRILDIKQGTPGLEHIEATEFDTSFTLASGNNLPLYVTLGRVKDAISTYRSIKCNSCLLPRPPMLVGRPAAYGITMMDGSMEPQHSAGDTLYADPQERPQVGKSAVFWKRANGDTKVRVLCGIQIDANNDKTVHYVVKTRVSSDGQGEETLSTSEWEVHPIIGTAHSPIT